jgi:NADH-quinone oxidoreductase subunit G
MVVETDTDEVKQARKSVLEFMLINHPLDCPVCDKAGECDLQNLVYDWRDGLSRFLEEKVIRHKKDIGPYIRYYGSRCILCGRCVRFCNEIAGTEELSVTLRGDHSVIDVFPGRPLDNPLSLNVVDLCPVGAMANKDFLFQARTWFLKKEDTICPSCARGCNITVSTLDGSVKRLQPRCNLEINSYWMCDYGRLNYKYITSEKRLLKNKGDIRELKNNLQKIESGSIAGIISTYATVEEIYLFSELMEVLKSKYIGCLTRIDGERFVSKSGFVIEPDKTPNKRGALIILGEEIVKNGLWGVIDGINQGKIKGLLIIGGIPDFDFPKELVDCSRKLDFLAVCDILENEVVKKANLILAGATFVEKEGSFINSQGRLQGIKRILPYPGEARPEIEILQSLLVELGARSGVVSSEDILKEAGRKFSLL